MGYKKGEVLKTGFKEFTIIQQKGQGGAGEVYEVRDSENQPFAVKILSNDKTTPKRLQRFKREYDFCSKNTSPRILSVLQYGIAPKGETFYVMPLYETTLRKLISVRIPAPDVLHFFSQILDGVDAAHLQGVWHRDLKPANILFSTASGLVIADFGIAHFEEDELLTAVETKSQEILANFEYAAPEQRRRGGTVDGKADIYALGLILNEMFTGKVPQGTGFTKVSSIAPDFSYLDDLVELMIRQDPTERPSIPDVKRELQNRGNEFVALQQLNAERSRVIPETEIDDPFILNPIRITGADFENGWIIYKLSATPPPLWIQSFRNPRYGYSGYYLRGPQSFNIQGDTAQVQLERGENIEQMSIYAKQYIDLANQLYTTAVAESHKKSIEARKEAQQQAIQKAEQRRKALAELSKVQF